MRRVVARGRVFPQYFSTDRRYGRLSLKACALFPLMWANADDQGRLTGDPEEVKYAVCPNIDHIPKADVPTLLEELDKNRLIKLYSTSETQAIQLLDWWVVAKLQWARPSEYDPPDGWEDRLRYKVRPEGPVITQNWTPKDKMQELGLPPGLSPGQSGGQHQQRESSRENPEIEKEIEEEIETRNRNKPGAPPGLPGGQSGEKSSSPSLTGPPLLDYLTGVFPEAFGRKPNSRELAQLRDLGKEISSAGGATAEQVYDAFKEACSLNKLSISYVRAVLRAWLGLERGPPA